MTCSLSNFCDVHANPLLPSAALQLEDVEKEVAFLSQNSIDAFVIKDGHLAVRSTWERFCYNWGFGHPADDVNMREYLQKIHDFCESKIWLHSGRDWSHLTQLFYFKVVAKVKHGLFDRTWISKRMQNHLSPELAVLRKEKMARGSYRTPADVLAIKVAKARLAADLGVGPLRSKKGVTGALVYVDLKGKELGIFKPVKEREEFLSTLRHLWRASWGFDSQTFYCRKGGKVPDLYSEISASAVDNFLKYRLTPPTDQVTLQGRIGSFMVWVHNSKHPSRYKIPAEGINERELERFQKFAIEDYLIGNLDRHSDNWLLQLKNGHLDGITAIDNANAFTEKNPADHTRWARWVTFWIRRQQYQWRHFPLANLPFSEESREEMRKLTPVTVDSIIAQLRFQLPPTDDRDAFLSEEMIEKLRQRACVLRKAAEQSDFNPRQLAALYSDTSIQAFLEKA
jgi:Phosphatidylinositol 3- and 4-kinase